MRPPPANVRVTRSLRDSLYMSEDTIVSVGAPVVSRDGVKLGEVQEVAESGILFGREFGPLLRMPAACFALATTGALRLRFDAADIRVPERRHAVMGQ